MRMKITILQSNPVIGDFDGALQTLGRGLQKAQQDGADLLLTSELFIGGYPAQDAWLAPGFWAQVDHARTRIAGLSKDYPSIAICVGLPIRQNAKPYNAAVLWEKGQEIHIQTKRLLPDYDVFNESRYFTPGDQTQVLEWRGERIGILICEDAWFTQIHNSHYTQDPLCDLESQQLSLVLHLSASPFETTKPEVRHDVVSAIAKRAGCPVVMVNQVGLQDDIIFDGGSLIISPNDEIWYQAPAWQEVIQTIDLQNTSAQSITFQSPSEARFNALTLAIRDYVAKSGFKKVVLGLSGGVDSALIAVLAVEALGPEAVTAIMMPSPYSSQNSLKDALALLQTLKIQHFTLPISDLYAQAKAQFSVFAPQSLASLTTENLQSRLRGLILMAYSNEHQALLLNTGNKSELAMGYCTLYGDMNGALGVIGDLYKTEVYALCEWINAQHPRIPTAILTKAPSAELRPNQKDEDTLPEYGLLDQILIRLIEQNQSPSSLIAQGFPEQTVRWIATRLHQNEYKRAQAPLVPKLSLKSFGKGRRYPILQKMIQ